MQARSDGIVIEAARLRLRTLREHEAGDLAALIGDWPVARWLSRVPLPYTEADARAWIALVRQDHATGRPKRFAVALAGDDRLIGGCGFDGSSGDGSDEPALGYWLGQAWWGQGYASEAVAALIDYGFRSLGFDTVRAYTDPANTRSQRVLSRCGLRPAGDIDLTEPTRGGATRAPLFRISRRDLPG